MELWVVKVTRPVFDQINIVSADLEASVAFYRRLGVEVPESNVYRTATGAHHATMEPSQANTNLGLAVDSVAFARVWNTGWAQRPDLAGRVVVGFRLPSRESVDQVYADLTAAGYKGLQVPHDAFWGARYAIVQDPDGVAVGLMSPASREHVAPPDV
jgi:catechol 2,3-dioxygenase-like lactoylglutathione lyase family enzyme